MVSKYTVYIYIFIISYHITSYHIICTQLHIYIYKIISYHIPFETVNNTWVLYTSFTYQVPSALQTLLDRHWTCWWTTTRSSKGATNGAITTGDVQYIRFVYIHKYTIIFNKYMSCVYIYIYTYLYTNTYNQSVLHLLLFICFYMCMYIYIYCFFSVGNI